MPLIIYTDGGCDKHGYGGWGWVRQESGKPDVEGYQGCYPTTNNQMELMAAIMALEGLPVAEFRVCVECKHLTLINGDDTLQCEACWGPFRPRPVYRGLQPIVIHADSQYVIKGITDWVTGWKLNGWKTHSGAGVKNQELWQRLDALARMHSIEWRWVKGHAGVHGNERADALATLGRKEMMGVKD